MIKSEVVDFTTLNELKIRQQTIIWEKKAANNVWVWKAKRNIKDTFSLTANKISRNVKICVQTQYALFSRANTADLLSYHDGRVYIIMIYSQRLVKFSSFLTKLSHISPKHTSLFVDGSLIREMQDCVGYEAAVVSGWNHCWYQLRCYCYFVVGAVD